MHRAQTDTHIEAILTINEKRLLKIEVAFGYTKRLLKFAYL